MASSACVTDMARAAACRDGAAAAHLKVVSIFVIFVTSVAGMSLPVLLAGVFRGKPLYDKAIVVIKCFAAGVILSTSLVHVLPDAYAALADCQVASRHPWKDFPFSGLVTLVGVLLALLVDLAASSHVEHAQYAPVVGQEKELELGGGCHGSGGDGERGEELAKLKQRLVSQAGFSFGTIAYMCLMFAVTTPMGIILGMALFSLTGYDDSNPNALILEGLLGSISSGILIYMALVDLIAVDFFHNKLMNSTPPLKKISFLALTLGSAAMSILALWA
ncbi:hypothetical protein ACSQ67_017568 [Phaseolus vulgaris]